MTNTIIHKCPKCPKIYKSLTSLKKHTAMCMTKSSDTVNVAVSAPNNLTNETSNETSNDANDIVSQMKAALNSSSSKLKQTTQPSKQPATQPTTQTTDSSSQNTNNKNYDISMTFGEGNKVHIDMKEQNEAKNKNDDVDDDESIDGSELKEILRPKISHTYQDEINKLENLIDLFKNMPISSDPAKKDITITQLKNTLVVLLSQSQNLIKEMKIMAHRSSFYKNNIMLSSYLLDRCRHEVPDDEEEFEEMFNERMRSK